MRSVPCKCLCIRSGTGTAPRNWCRNGAVLVPRCQSGLTGFTGFNRRGAEHKRAGRFWPWPGWAAVVRARREEPETRKMSKSRSVASPTGKSSGCFRARNTPPEWPGARVTPHRSATDAYVFTEHPRCDQARADDCVRKVVARAHRRENWRKSDAVTTDRKPSIVGTGSAHRKSVKVRTDTFRHLYGVTPNTVKMPFHRLLLAPSTPETSITSPS